MSVDKLTRAPFGRVGVTLPSAPNTERKLNSRVHSPSGMVACAVANSIAPLPSASRYGPAHTDPPIPLGVRVRMVLGSGEEVVRTFALKS